MKYILAMLLLSISCSSYGLKLRSPKIYCYPAYNVIPDITYEMEGYRSFKIIQHNPPLTQLNGNFEQNPEYFHGYCYSY